ncbi:MAG TPA: hypothetical protein ENF55_04760 [Thermoprotei archaeon]|nr:MAG: hypothetical protein DRJ63_00490 [Thermoprotei archaeon]HDI75250.1 hypothetical protein [Thermoprotei archaeon]
MPSHTAVIRIAFQDRKLASTLYKAIAPDAEEREVTPKGTVHVSLAEDTLVILIKAKDLAGLRAMINSYLRNLMAAKKSLDSLLSPQG